MPKNNPYFPKLPETATVSYFNENEWNKDLSVEEINKREQLAEFFYQDQLLNGVKIGPGFDKEIGEINGKKVVLDNCQHLIHTLNDYGDKSGCPWQSERDNMMDINQSFESQGTANLFNLRASLQTSEGGLGGSIIGGGAALSAFRASDGRTDIKLLGGTVGAEAGIGLGGVTAGYQANFDIVSSRVGGVQARIGPDGGSNFTLGVGGVDVKVAGLGVSIGKKMGISTPFGGVSVDLEETCSVQ